MKGFGWLVSLPAIVLVAGCASTSEGEWIDLLKQLIDEGRYEELALGLQDLYAESPEAGDEVVSYGLDHVRMPPDGNRGDLQNSRALLDALDVPAGGHQTTVLYGKGLAAWKSGDDRLALEMFREVSTRVDVKDEHKAICLLGLCRLDSEGGEVNQDHWQEFVNLQGEIGSALTEEDLERIRQVVSTGSSPSDDMSLEALFGDNL